MVQFLLQYSKNRTYFNIDPFLKSLTKLKQFKNIGTVKYGKKLNNNMCNNFR